MIKLGVKRFWRKAFMITVNEKQTQCLKPIFKRRWRCFLLLIGDEHLAIIYLRRQWLIREITECESII